jgi:Ner family transcriptional regulator
VLDLKRHAEIRARLIEAGTTLRALARDIGVAPATLITVSQGHRTSHRVQSELAAKLGLTPEELFPDRYSAKEDPMSK